MFNNECGIVPTVDPVLDQRFIEILKAYKGYGRDEPMSIKRFHVLLDTIEADSYDKIAQVERLRDEIKKDFQKLRDAGCSLPKGSLPKGSLPSDSLNDDKIEPHEHDHAHEYERDHDNILRQIENNMQGTVKTLGISTHMNMTKNIGKMYYILLSHAPNEKNAQNVDYLRSQLNKKWDIDMNMVSARAALSGLGDKGLLCRTKTSSKTIKTLYYAAPTGTPTNITE